jgi:hypothetical protein
MLNFDQQEFVQEEAKNVVGMAVKRERERERENEHMMRRTRGVSVLFREFNDCVGRPSTMTEHIYPYN